MLLELSNFRCFKNLQLELPDTGIVLLNGTSGIGKTTILKAISFVLFGKEIKCVKYGEKRCQVRMVYNNMDILRTKTPNHLTLHFKEQKYEDEPAQKIIHQQFGQHFQLTSYVAQKSIDNFLSLSYNAKMEFLNQLVLKEVDIAQLKDKTKQIIKDRKQSQMLKTNELRVLKNEFENLPKPNVLQWSAAEIQDKIQTIKEQKQSLQQQKSVVVMKQKTLQQQQQQYQQQIQIEEERKRNETILQQIRQQQNELSVKLQYFEPNEWVNAIGHYEWKVKLESLNNDLNLYKKMRLKSLRSELDQLIISPMEHEEQWMSCIAHEKSLEQIRDFFLKYQVNEMNEMKHEWKQQLANENETVKQQIQKLDNLLLNELKCPECRSELVLKNNQLHKRDCQEPMTPVEAKKKIQLLEKQLEHNRQQLYDWQHVEKLIAGIPSFKVLFAFYEANADKFNLVKNNIRLRDQAVNKQQQLLQEIQKVESQQDNMCVQKQNAIESHRKKQSCVFPSSDRFLQLVQTEINIEQLPELEEYEDEEILDNLKSIKQDCLHLQMQFDKLEKQAVDIRKQMRSEQTVIDGKSLETEIAGVQQHMQQLQEQSEQCIQEEFKWQQLFQEKEKEEKWMQFQSRITQIENEEKELVHKASTSEKLYKLINDAEAISITNTIANINHIIGHYTQEFFSEGNMQIQMVPYKETAKDKKAGLDFELYQNGEKIALDNLSGGEFDRVLLIVFLAFNQITNSSLVMLDESLSSLNADLVEGIIDVLKEQLRDKLVLITLHQANTGLFDHVIHVEQLSK